MGINIIKAADRLKQKPKINIALFGESGAGKTTQARTLDPKSTLFTDLEAGTLAIQGWSGDVLDIIKSAQALNAHPWELAKAFACLIGGPDPTDENGAYSLKAYEQYKALIDPKSLEVYDTVFVDSITVASRLCFSWCQRQPEAFSEKTGKPDTRGAYGLLGREMIRWLTHLQHCPKSIITVGILDRKVDDLGRISYVPQVEGAKTGNELPGIFDQVLTLAHFKTEEGVPYRAFVTQLMNQWGYPAKDRSGCLELLEPPDLGQLIDKIRAGKRLDTEMVRTIPAETKKQ